MERRKPILWGLVLIALGILALFNALGVEWLDMERLWPGVLMVVGAISVVNALKRNPRESGGVWFGLIAILGGGFFLYITLGFLEWRELQTMWPVFPLIGALAWLVAWFVDMRQVSNLVAALIAAAVAGLGYVYTAGKLAPESGLAILEWWPLILVVLGIGMLVQFAIQRR